MLHMDCHCALWAFCWACVWFRGAVESLGVVSCIDMIHGLLMKHFLVFLRFFISDCNFVFLRLLQ